MSILLGQLESQHDFKACVAHCDFILGHTIIENITDSIIMSSCTHHSDYGLYWKWPVQLQGDSVFQWSKEKCYSYSLMPMWHPRQLASYHVKDWTHWQWKHRQWCAGQNLSIFCIYISVNIMWLCLQYMHAPLNQWYRIRMDCLWK